MKCVMPSLAGGEKVKLEAMKSVVSLKDLIMRRLSWSSESDQFGGAGRE
jgi:hypothetical protein